MEPVVSEIRATGLCVSNLAVATAAAVLREAAGAAHVVTRSDESCGPKFAQLDLSVVV